jgi:hypothetical protein
MRSGINKMETKKIIQKVNKTKIWLFIKINKIDKPLVKLTETGRKKT